MKQYSKTVDEKPQLATFLNSVCISIHGQENYPDRFSSALHSGYPPCPSLFSHPHHLLLAQKHATRPRLKMSLTSTPKSRFLHPSSISWLIPPGAYHASSCVSCRLEHVLCFRSSEPYPLKKGLKFRLGSDVHFRGIVRHCNNIRIRVSLHDGSLSSVQGLGVVRLRPASRNTLSMQVMHGCIREVAPVNGLAALIWLPLYRQPRVLRLRMILTYGVENWYWRYGGGK